MYALIVFREYTSGSYLTINLEAMRRGRGGGGDGGDEGVVWRKVGGRILEVCEISAARHRGGFLDLCVCVRVCVRVRNFVEVVLKDEVHVWACVWVCASVWCVIVCMSVGFVLSNWKL